MTPAEKFAAEKPLRNGHAVAWRRVAWRCRVREFREPLGLTLGDVAGECGLTEEGLRLIEKGCDPRLTTARRLAAFFGKSVGELWPDLAGEKGGEKP